MEWARTINGNRTRRCPEPLHAVLPVGWNPRGQFAYYGCRVGMDIEAHARPYSLTIQSAFANGVCFSDLEARFL
jgi:hypothetical protein